MKGIPQDIRRPRWLRLVLLAVLCLVLLSLAWHELAQWNALWAYRRSRAYPFSGLQSLEFLSLGVVAGDTAAEVDRKLAGAVLVAGPSPLGPHWPTMMKYYEFRYGRGILLPSSTPLLTESLTVFFDVNGGAEVIEHSLTGRDGSRRHRLNLITRTVESLN